METEIEAKFLDVDKDKIRIKLNEIGATLIFTERIMERNIFDYPDCRLENIGGWIRVRDEGDKITLSYKQLNGRTLHGTKEINLVVDSFDVVSNFLTIIGLEKKSYQETKQELWKLDNVEISIDTWLWIPTFVEVEGPNEKGVKKISLLLGFDWKYAMHGSVETVYQKDYDVTEEEIDHWNEITFVPVPNWLEKKRIS